MGNVLLQGPSKKGDPAEQYQRWLQQNPDLVGKQILSENKLFRTSSYKINGRNILIKVFFKRDQSALTQYLKIFQFFNQIHDRHKTTNILPLKLFNDKDNQAFVVAYRQKLSQTLQQVISAKPTPTSSKKKWLIYQMIKAVHTLHKNFNFYHGHIRTSNFVITTYGYLMLTDFSFYKPLYMIEDSEEGLPQFRLFYGSSVNNCTLAPEKIIQQAELKNRQRSPAKVFASFQSSSSNNVTNSMINLEPVSLQSSMSMSQSIPPGNLSLTATRSQMEVRPKNFQGMEGNLKARNAQSLDVTRYRINFIDQVYNLQKMDIFSLGCSILQVIRDGKPILNFQSYLKFKKGQFSLDPIIDEACKDIDDSEIIKKMLKSMLALNPDDRPQIEQIKQTFNGTINNNTYSLIWQSTSAFSTASFFLPDLRIALVHSILKFIQIQERGVHLDFKIRPPKCFQSFQALKIFRSILKNKIIHVGQIPQNSILSKILNSNEKQNLVDSQEQQIMHDGGDVRKQFFIPFVSKRSPSPMRMSTAMIPRLQKVLTPPQWNRQLKGLVQPKYKGIRLTQTQILKNRFQDLLQQYKKSQSIRQMRIKQASTFYNQYNMVIRTVYSSIRGCRYNASKLLGIQMLMAVAKQSNDSVRLTRMMPLLISLLDDPDIMTSKYAFNSIIDVFYMFIDPFKNDQQIPYYDLIIQMFINSIKTPRLRVNLFQRLQQIYQICQWLQVHIRKISKRAQTKYNLKKFVDIIKNNFGSYHPHQVRQLMIHIPDIMWPEMFQFFISFLNTQKILGLKKGVSITQIDVESHKKIIDVIDNCIESSLDQNGISLFYAIKYFTVRKVFTPIIVKKVAPMVIHPHLWVREQAKQYIQMCLIQNPPTRVFFLFRQIFSPPFPLQIKDINDDILLPQPLLQSQVDFQKKKIKQTKKIGITQKLFSEYLEKVKASKIYPITKQNQLQQWQSLYKLFGQQKIEPTPFNNYIKKSIYELYQANFLYYVGNVKSPFKPGIKQEQKKKQYEELNQALKKLSISVLEDSQVAYEKKDFFTSLCNVVNSNFEKLLTRFMKQDKDKSNKIRISESIYLIMEALYKFQQFNIKQVFKLGDYNTRMSDLERPERLKGNLITEIYQHKDMVTCLQNIADRYLISGSYDGTIRVFNTRKIEVNITCQSEGLYEMASDNMEQKVRINSLAAFQNTYTIAAATNKGNIRVFQIQRMKGKGESNRTSISENTSSQLKYFVGGQIQKILTFKNQNRNECFCFITAQGVLGVQDIRTRSKTLTCNFGKERGLPKSLAFSTLGPSILIGTLDGYVLTYDIRCNIISNIRQLIHENGPVCVTGIYPSPIQVQGRNIFAFTYPSKYYQFSYFDIYNDSQNLLAEKHYSSCDREDIISVPTMVNLTKQQNFKLCNNNLSQKIYYKQLADFNRNFKILEYVSDPFTIKQSKVREVWMDRCKHRYNQIYSIYNKKSLPFIEHLSSGILTNMNPCLGCPGDKKSNKNLSVLVDRIQTKEYFQIEKLVTCKPASSKIFSFQDEQNADYLTTCKSVGNMTFVGGWDSVIKVYR